MVLFNTPSVKVYACPAVEIYNNNNFKFSQGDVRSVCRFPIQLGVGGVSSTQTFQTLLHNERYARLGLSSRLDRSREFLATDTKMASTLVHSKTIEKKSLTDTG